MRLHSLLLCALFALAALPSLAQSQDLIEDDGQGFSCFVALLSEFQGEVMASTPYIAAFQFPADRQDVFVYQQAMRIDFRVGPAGQWVSVPVDIDKDFIHRWGICPGINWTIPCGNPVPAGCTPSSHSLEWDYPFTFEDVIAGIEVRLVNSDGRLLGAPCVTYYALPPLP